MQIRHFKKGDEKDIKRIHFETGFVGKTMSTIIDNQDYWSEDINYYLTKEPESIFVAEDEGKVIGYLLGCLDDNKQNEIINFLLHTIKNIIRLPFMNKKDRKFWSSQISFIVGAIIGKYEDAKFKTPKNSGHLHINLDKEKRGKAVGSKLIDEFVKYCKNKGVKLIHADSYETRLNPNKNFWIKNGFKEFSKVKSSFWKQYLPNERINVVCYTKKIE